MATQPGDVAALAESTRVPLDPARFAVIAAALDAFTPLLDSLDVIPVDDDDPPPVFDPRW